MHLKKLCTDL